MLSGQPLGQPLTNILKTSIIGTLREERKWNHIKCTIKAREGSKREKKKKNKELNE